MTQCSCTILTGLLLAMSAVAPMPAAEVQGKWADPRDPVAKALIDLEKQWAEGACTNAPIEEKILAEDFQGTSPEDGRIYSKADSLRQAKEGGAPSGHGCQLYGAKVRFFGDALAIVYGSETAVHKGKDGKDVKRSLVWTDTWLKRNGNWQIIAAQDMNMERK